MEQKQVKITGLKVNQQLGILQAVKLDFDENNKLTVIKGETGSGKTTAQKSLQLGTQGNKALKDNQLYGNIDIETQLLDGDQKIFVGCRSDKQGKLKYTLYMKDDEGNIVKNPVVDGVKATPKKYLETLQTKLTWRMDELTSENPTVQKNILFELYKDELSKVGIDQMQGKIDKAKSDRDQKDAYRKQVGGIAEDLKAQGFDVNRPNTLPARKDIAEIEEYIRKLEEEKTTKKVEGKNEKQNKLSEIKAKAAEVTNKCFQYNRELEKKYNDKLKEWENERDVITKVNQYFDNIDTDLTNIVSNNRLLQEKKDDVMNVLSDSINFKCESEEPTEPNYIPNDGQKITAKSAKGFPGEAAELIEELLDLRKKYNEIEATQEEVPDISDYDNKIQQLKEDKLKAENINKICDAIDAFDEWKEANDRVQELNKEYAKKLAEVNTGVEGLRIVPEENENGKLDIYLMYNGYYDPEYFRNPNKEYRKLSSYSGTQKPMIALLVQNYLLSQKPKALRYMFIDDHPIDKRTRQLLEKICNELDIHIFVNVTGDFERSNLKEGEMLIEGGELILNKE